MESRFIWLIVLFVLLGLNTQLNGQAIPQVNVRFANPSFDHQSREYSLEVELNSASEKEVLFSMNVRFFYDANMLEFNKLDQIKPGYALLGEAPKAMKGNDQSGSQLFGWDGAASYVNGAIQQEDETTPLEIYPDKWVKTFRVTFKVPLIFPDEQKFCPGAIWDIRSDLGTGGFMQGSDGLVVTVIENDLLTRNISEQTKAMPSCFNWVQTSEESMPYGHPQSQDCISINEVTATEDPDYADKKGYALFQNTPNPFAAATIIEFILPFAQEASMKFYDVSGKSYEEIKGFYKEGKNSITIERKPWMTDSKIVFYRLETENYNSGIRKMTVVQL
ncbi:MAG: hypothetical protein ABIQ11_01055 [Saprospiraceae bacterium]